MEEGATASVATHQRRVYRYIMASERTEKRVAENSESVHRDQVRHSIASITHGCPNGIPERNDMHTSEEMRSSFAVLSFDCFFRSRVVLLVLCSTTRSDSLKYRVDIHVKATKTEERTTPNNHAKYRSAFLRKACFKFRRKELCHMESICPPQHVLLCVHVHVVT